MYYQSASQIWESFLNSPSEGLNNLMLDSGEFYLSDFDAKLRFLYFESPNEWFLSRIAGIANLFSFNNYICITVLFCYFSFLGTWAFFQSVAERYPSQNYSLTFVIIFLTPSVLVWTSGLLKDTICLGLIGFILNGFFKIIESKKVRIHLVAQSVLWVTLWKLKPYLAIVLLIALFAWGAVYAYQSIGNKRKKRLVLILAFFVFMLAGSQINNGIDYLENQNSYYSAIQKIKGYHSEYERTKESGASVYTLGEIEYSPLGILQKIPEAIATTFFRPYPWEANKTLLIVMSTENIALFSVILFICIKYWKNLFSLGIWREPAFVMSLVFILLLAVIVGLTSYNFGLLMRLKTPMIPFIGILLHFISKEKIS